MRNAGGYLLICDDGRTVEKDSFTCGHDNRVVFVEAGQDPAAIGGLCKLCMRMICPQCVGQPCITLERRLEAAEASYHARRSYGL